MSKASEITVTYTNENGEQQISAKSLPELSKALAEAGYDGLRLKAFEGETLRGWVSADGWKWA